MVKRMSAFLQKSVSGWRITLWLGLMLFMYFGAQSAGGIGYGVVKGIDTLSWPSTTAWGGMKRRCQDPAHPTYEWFDVNAHFVVRGKKYDSAKINIQGNNVLKGRKAARTNAVLNSMRPGIIYYNPDDPSEALLEPGITFSPHTWTRIYGAVFGLVVAGFGYWGRAHSLRRATRGA